MLKQRYFVVKEIAKILGRQPDTIRRMFREGLLPGAYKPGGRPKSPIRMSERDLKRYIKKRKGRR